MTVSAIEFLIKRLKKAKKADLIVLCTTEMEEDELLCQISSKCGIDFFRGSVSDKLMRWLGAAEKFNVEFFVTADGDDLFCDPELIDSAFNQYENSRPDMIEAQDLPCGAFTFGIKTGALKKVCEIKASDDTEMMWGYFKEANIFKIEKLQDIEPIYKRPEIRMTLDYPDDFKFFKAVINGLGGPEKEFSLKDIIIFLDNNPDILNINQHLRKEFEENQKRRTKIVFKEGWNNAQSLR